jgi:hypothetical protein
MAPEKRITLEGYSLGTKRAPLGQQELGQQGVAQQQMVQARRIFLLSPANASGLRAKMLFSPNAGSELAQRLQQSGVPLGEVYSFISGLYFRGKLAYAEQFQNPSPGAAGVYIITAAAGLLPPETMVTLPELQRISAEAVDAENPKYRMPLDRDASRLCTLLESGTQVILLGSIVTPKYVVPLLEIFGERLLFPKDFVGRGDMSRGGLLLRCCSQNSPLEYVPVRGAIQNGPRPPKLAPPPARTSANRKPR